MFQSLRSGERIRYLGQSTLDSLYIVANIGRTLRERGDVTGHFRSITSYGLLLLLQSLSVASRLIGLVDAPVQLADVIVELSCGGALEVTGANVPSD